MKIAAELNERVGRAAQRAGVSVTGSITINYWLEHPADLKNGDYSTAVAIQYAKQAGLPPLDFAEKIRLELGDIPDVKEIKVAGAGFINFYLDSSVLAEAIEDARGESWGRNETNKSKKVMVEYTDPNPFKEFHIGHLMSNAIGESIARLIEFTGAEVKRANYQGDIGPHVAKALFVLLERGSENPPAKEIGAAYVEGARRYENDARNKDAIDELNISIYRHTDKRVEALYKKGRQTCLEAFEKIYTILGTKFDYYFFESEAAPKGIEIVKSHSEVFAQSEGATVYHGPHTRVFITSKGLPTYEAKELGLAKMKATTWPFDESISVTAHEQSGYFEVVLAAMREVFPELASKIKHISHGMMRLPSGKMSSRTGEVITGESLLNDLIGQARARAKESRAEQKDKIAQDVAVAAVKYQILKQASGRDIVFDRERALSLEGDSGPYLQYAHARAHQLVEKASSQGLTLRIPQGQTLEISENANNLARLLRRFPEAVEYAARELEPHLLTNYLLEFASTFNRWYANEHILDGSTDSPQKVALTDAVRSTLKNGLWLLGIPAPEKM